MKLRICVVGIAMLALGCGGGSPREDLFGPEIRPGDVVIETRHSGVLEPLRLVIRSESEWRPILTAISEEQGAPPSRAVDFRREMIILAALGEQTEAGRSVTFAAIQRVPGEIIADVLELLPDPRCETVEIRTTPLVAVAVPRSDLPVRFIERSELLPACP